MIKKNDKVPASIETSRLRLRPFKISDAPFILTLLNTEAWLNYIGDRNIRNQEAAELYLRGRILRSYEDNGYGLLMVCEKESGEALGMCGLVKREGLLFPDLGFAFLPEHGRKGYALESAEAVLDYVRKELTLEKLQAITVAENQSSIRLLEKLGMQNKGKVTLPDDKDVLLLYELELKNSSR